MAPSSPRPFVLLCGSEQLSFPGGGVRGRRVSSWGREAGVTGPGPRGLPDPGAAVRAQPSVRRDWQPLLSQPSNGRTRIWVGTERLHFPHIFPRALVWETVCRNTETPQA